MPNNLNIPILQNLQPTPNIQNNTQYVTDGLEIVSNSDASHTRDGRGNITLTSGSATNQAVIIENNYDSFTNRSFVNASKTSFNYFKFPPTRFFASASLPDLSSLSDAAADTVVGQLTTRYTLPYLGNQEGFDYSLYRINTLEDSYWYAGDVVGGSTTGVATSGFRRIPFTGPLQQEEGAYIFTPEIIKLLRDTGKTIKFDIQCQYLENQLSIYNSYIWLQVGRGTPTNYREFPNSTFKLAWNSPDQVFPFIRLQFVVDIENDTFDYDKFVLNTTSRFQSWIAVGSSYWNIDVIDIGSEPVGFAYDNVQSNTSVYIPYANSFPIEDSFDFNTNGQQLVTAVNNQPDFEP